MSKDSSPIILAPGATLLAIVKEGMLLHYTGNIALSHAEFVKRSMGTLPEGAWVGTVQKQGKVVVTMNSKTYYGNQMPAPQAVEDAIHAVFK